MSERRYYHPDTTSGRVLHEMSAREALSWSMSNAPGPSWSGAGPARVCAAIFAVLTIDQQERALQALGWVPHAPKLPEPGTEPTAAVHDPDRAARLTYVTAPIAPPAPLPPGAVVRDGVAYLPGYEPGLPCPGTGQACRRNCVRGHMCAIYSDTDPRP